MLNVLLPAAPLLFASAAHAQMLAEAKALAVTKVNVKVQEADTAAGYLYK